jgi:hypothetical protein
MARIYDMSETREPSRAKAENKPRWTQVEENVRDDEYAEERRETNDGAHVPRETETAEQGREREDRCFAKLTVFGARPRNKLAPPSSFTIRYNPCRAFRYPTRCSGGFVGSATILRG